MQIQTIIEVLRPLYVVCPNVRIEGHLCKILITPPDRPALSKAVDEIYETAHQYKSSNSSNTNEVLAYHYLTLAMIDLDSMLRSLDPDQHWADFGAHLIQSIFYFDNLSY